MTTLRRGHLGPRTALESLTGSCHSQIDISCVAFRYLRQNFAGGGVIGFKSLARLRVNPLAPNQKFSRSAYKLLNRTIELYRHRYRGHVSSIVLIYRAV